MTPEAAAQLRRDVAGARAAHRRLLDTVAGFTDADLARPSLLPDWTIGHVLAHLARNADSHVRMLEAGARGEVADQYVGGADGRAQEIERDAGRSAAETSADVATSIEALEACWASTPDAGWAGEGRSVVGTVPLADLPFRRWRETEVHHADLGHGYGPQDWPSLYVRLETARMEQLWAARRPMGMTKLPAEAMAASPAHRLAWLLGRAEIDGLEPAGIF